jgi:hypothetical protein
VWRCHPSLKNLQNELLGISNEDQARFDSRSRVHDWFHTRLYHHIYATREIAFNWQMDPEVFNTTAEVQAAISELSIKQKARQDSESEGES